MRMRIALCVALLAGPPVSAWGESPQEFATRIGKTRGLVATVNVRDDGAFGSLALALPPALVEDPAAIETVGGEIGRYAAAAKLKAYVVTPTREDNERIVARLKAAGVATISTRVMVEATSNRTTRVFLTPDGAAKP